MENFTNILLALLSLVIGVITPFFWNMINGLLTRVSKLEVTHNDIENKTLLNERELESLKERIDENTKHDDRLRDEVNRRSEVVRNVEMAIANQNSILLVIAERMGVSDLIKKIIK